MDSQRKKQLTQGYKERRHTGCIYALKNQESGRRLVQREADTQSAHNRYAFFQATGSCPHPKLAADFDKLGAPGFQLEILEQLEQGETQTELEFREELKTLEALWKEKLGPEALY